MSAAVAGRFCGPAEAAAQWHGRWAATWPATDVLLLLAATDTAAVSGISAAGATPESRRRTAAAPFSAAPTLF